VVVTGKTRGEVVTGNVVVRSEIFRSAIPSSEVVTRDVVVTGKIFRSEVGMGNVVAGVVGCFGGVGCFGAVVAGQVGFFFGDVGSFGAGWRLVGKIGGAEFLATRAHYWASSL
jgi:hypothetical protein